MLDRHRPLYAAVSAATALILALESALGHSGRTVAAAMIYGALRRCPSSHRRLGPSRAHRKTGLARQDHRMIL
jgi:hypothetical protein